jgi:predicted TIM-barrel fold metal-dependent hydrolase
MLRPEARETFWRGKVDGEALADELSGIPPAKLLEYFPRLEEIADKVIWSTDWPSPGVASMRRNVDRFLTLPLSDETKRKILFENAARIFR